MSARVVMSDLFGRSYSELDGSIKNRVLDFIVKLQERPDAPGLDLKTPQGVSDHRVKTARVNDFWRAVLIELPESSGFVLVGVKPHDDAYVYAERLTFGVNEVTGALEVIDQAALDEAVGRVEKESKRPDAQPLLSHVRTRDLKRFGIGEEIAVQLVQVTAEDQLLGLAEALPALQGNAVLDLATGRTPEDVWDDLVAEEPETVDTSDVVSALERPLSRLTFTEGRDIDELRAVLEGDFKAWRVWLHPLQRRLAYHDGWSGPFRVTGGAGTGKTVTAIHRARYLAQRLEDTRADGKVLVTTFTKNLAQSLQSQLVELAGPEILGRVDVLNIDALAARILHSGREDGHRGTLRADNDQSIMDVWESARRGMSNQWDLGFLQSEWTDVVLAQGIDDRNQYLAASRSGRGRRLSRPQRAELWTIFERFTQLLNAQDVLTFTQAASRAALIASRTHDAAPLETKLAATLPRYVHAIVDEAQDLHPAHWRLIRALVPAGADDLFIVGDAHQRIYGRPVVLSRLGIETRGRSRRLKVNYRTSREILRWSLSVAHGEAVDDLEGADETLAGARSEFSGPTPVAAAYDTVAKEKAGLNNVLNDWHEAGIGWSEVAVVARQRSFVEDVRTAIESGGIPAVEVDAKADEAKLPDGVRVMTMHRAKGLEFRAVAVVGASQKDLPPWAVRNIEGEERDSAWARERSLLYVCGSRARERLYISWVGAPSELLPAG